MEDCLTRIQEALNKGHYTQALREGNGLLLCHQDSSLEEDKETKDRIIGLIHGSGMSEKILGHAEVNLKEGGSIAWSSLYELYKFEVIAFGKVGINTAVSIIRVWASWPIPVVSLSVKTSSCSPK